MNVTFTILSDDNQPAGTITGITSGTLPNAVLRTRGQLGMLELDIVDTGQAFDGQTVYELHDRGEVVYRVIATSE